MKDFKVPVAMVTFLAAQAGGMVWFLSGLQSRVATLEHSDSVIEMTASENRRYIREVIMPSYNISDAWYNPHYKMWLEQGGWSEVRECKHD